MLDWILKVPLILLGGIILWGGVIVVAMWFWQLFKRIKDGEFFED